MENGVAERIVANMDAQWVCAKCGGEIDAAFAAVWWKYHGNAAKICLPCFAVKHPISKRLLSWGWELWQSGGQINVYRRQIDDEAWELLSDKEGEEPTDWNKPAMVARYSLVLSPALTLETECIEGPVHYPTLYEVLLHHGCSEQRMWCSACGSYFGVAIPIYMEAIDDPDGTYILCPGCGCEKVEEAR